MQATAPLEHPTDTRNEIDFERINRALAEGIPATLTGKEVKAITGFTGSQIRGWIKNSAFPEPINHGQGSSKTHLIWASALIRDWLVKNGLPTAFGKAARS